MADHDEQRDDITDFYNAKLQKISEKTKSFPEYFINYSKKGMKNKSHPKVAFKWSSVGSGLLPSELPDSQTFIWRCKDTNLSANFQIFEKKSYGFNQHYQLFILEVEGELLYFPKVKSIFADDFVCCDKEMIDDFTPKAQRFVNEPKSIKLTKRLTYPFHTIRQGFHTNKLKKSQFYLRLLFLFPIFAFITATDEL